MASRPELVRSASKNKRTRARRIDSDAEKLGSTALTAATVSELKLRANQGDKPAASILSELYETGLRDKDGAWILRPSARASRRYLDLGIALGDADAMFAVANALGDGPRVDEARRLYIRSFRAGNATAGYNLACSYQSRGNHERALVWFRRALKAGEETALLPLGLAELYGCGTRRRPKAALAKLERLAYSKGTYVPPNALQCEAMLAIATALEQGWLVKRDYKRAMEWLVRAADLGSKVAAAMLGR